MEARPSSARRGSTGPVLHSLYGSRAVSLGEAVARLAGCHAAAPRDADGPEYRRLVTCAVAVLPAAAAANASRAPSLLQRSSQSEVVHRAIDTLVRSSGNSANSNVVCSGFRKRRPGGAPATYRGPNLMSSEPVAHGAVGVEVLCAAEWQTLLARVGDVVMLQLLKDCSIFLPLPNCCFLQVTGEPITKVVHRLRLTLSRGADRRQQGGAATAPGILGLLQTPPGLPRPLSPATQDASCDALDLSDDNIEVTSDSPAAALKQVDATEALHPSARGPGDGSQPRRVTQRPSSWQRRKARNAQSAKLGHSPSGQNQLAGLAILHEPVTQEIGASSGTSKQATVPTPRGWVSPSSRVVPRSEVFYSSAFSRRPGLPKKNILRQAAEDAEAGGHRLYCAIFGDGERLKVSGTSGSSRVWSSLPSKAFRVPPHVHKTLLPRLKTMIGRSTKAPYWRLLNHHCPLPGARPLQAGPVEADTMSLATQDTGSKGSSPPDSPADSAGHLEDVMDFLHSQAEPSTETAGEEAPTAGGPKDAPSPDDRAASKPTSNILQMTLAELSASWVPPSAVEGFVWGCVRSIVPQELLGPTAVIRQRVRHAIHQVIHMTRYESMTIHQAVQGISTASFSWMPGGYLGKGQHSQCGPQLQEKRKRWLVLWVEWLLGGLVLPLIRSHFYVTETEMTRLAVAYYRKPVWHRLRTLAVHKFSTKLYEELTPQDLSDELRRRTLGVASLRLVPKATGARPIVNMGSRTTVVIPPAPGGLHGGEGRRPRSAWAAACPTRSFSAINSSMRSAQQVVKAELEQQPRRLGGSVFGMNGVYNRLAPFLREQRQRAGGGRGQGPLYIIKADVKGAYDSVEIEKMLRLLGDSVGDGPYRLTQHAQVVSAPNGGARVLYRNSAVPVARPPGESRATPALLAAALASTQRVHVVIMNQWRDQQSLGSDTKRTLQEHLQRNLVRVQSKWLCQKHGVPQGSVVSSLLCSLYLADMEATHLDPLIYGTPDARQNLPSDHDMNSSSQGRDNEPTAQGIGSSSSLLARLIDDYIVLTRSRTVAEAVVHRFCRGFPDYHVELNQAKSALNFDTLVAGRPVPRNELVEAGGRRFIQWCGLLMNGDTLELQADYTRLHGIHLRNTMSLSLGSRPGAKLATKLCHYLRPKCHPLLLDTTINSVSTVRINIYQVLLVCAMKFHLYLREMPRHPGQKDVRVAAAAINVALGCVYSLVTRTYNVVEEQRKAAELQGVLSHGRGAEVGPIRVHVRISRCHIQWLGLHAFHTVLRRKQTSYKGGLLDWLSDCLKEPRFSHLKRQLRDVVDSQRHTFMADTRH